MQANGPANVSAEQAIRRASIHHSEKSHRGLGMCASDANVQDGKPLGIPVFERSVWGINRRAMIFLQQGGLENSRRPDFRRPDEDRIVDTVRSSRFDCFFRCFSVSNNLGFVFRKSQPALARRFEQDAREIVGIIQDGGSSLMPSCSD